MGGASKSQQMRQWTMGQPDIVVATPGRMLDILQSEPGVRQACLLARTVILDEADTLLDMGFKQELDAILNYLPSETDRQTFLFSATVSRDVQGIASKFLRPNFQFIDTVPPMRIIYISMYPNTPQYSLRDSYILPHGRQPSFSRCHPPSQGRQSHRILRYHP